MDSHAQIQERLRRLERKLRAELGTPILSALADERIVEIMVNPAELRAGACALWTESLDTGVRDTGVRLPAVQVENIICSVATLLDRVASPERPILEGELPFDGSRFEGFLPPVVSTPALVIRKRALLVFTLDDYVAQGVMSPAQREALRDAIRARRNILVAGGTGSGKTTLVNAVVKEMAVLGKPEERFVIIEDTVEIRSDAPNTLQLRTAERVDMDGLLRATLRARPDRIVIGETRGREALTLLKAWGTGHPGGVATVHANSCAGALERLDQLVQEAGVPTQARLNAETIDLVVHLERDGNSRRVREVAEVCAFQPETGAYRLERIA